MHIRFFFTLLFILSLAALVSSQNPPQKPKTIAKGVINGSAVSLPKPEYPPAAKAVKAGGAVEVTVTIDEEGNVVSATANSGHPLLQQAAVQAARQAKFQPTLLSGQPVKVTGRIVYNFVPEAAKEEPPVWAFGFLFSFLENADADLIKQIGDEKEFDQIFVDIAKDIPEEITAEKPLIEKLAQAKGEERRAVAGELNRALKKYFTPTEIWQVEIGENFGLLMVEMLKQIKNIEAGLPIEDSLLKMHLEKIKTSMDSVPPGVPEKQLKLFKPIADFAAPDLKSRDNLIKLFESISPLFNSISEENE